MLEKETGLPVLGCLPHMEEAALESRHLGLRTAGEIAHLAERLDRVAQKLTENLDWERFTALFDRRNSRDELRLPAPPKRRVPLAVARDEAFCFLYEETLDELRRAGAELRFFSPLRDAALPEDARALYLPGGYPELYAKALSANAAMLRSVREAVESGMPTVAECGGFLYLGRSLEGADGLVWPMAGVLPGEGVRKEKLVRFGYALLISESDNLLFRRGQAVPAHEFHYWDSTENGTGLAAKKPVSGRSWQCGFVSDRLYAAFPHLYFPGNPALAERFVTAALLYNKE